MGDKRRFELFADLIVAQIPAGARIADVAAGQGQLTFALRRRGFSRIVPFEPEPRRGGQVVRTGMLVRRFTPADAAGFDVLLGMHPDGATEALILGAAAHGATVFVVPCCTINATTVRGGTLDYEGWVRHLRLLGEHRGLELQETDLPMSGRKLVLWGRGRC